MESPHEQRSQSEIPVFGVAQMGFKELSEEVEKQAAEAAVADGLWNHAAHLAKSADYPHSLAEAAVAIAQKAQAVCEARSNALGAELATVTSEDPAKGRELTKAMARSEHPRDRWFAAFSVVNLVSIDPDLAGELVAELLTDPHWEVRSAARAAFSDGELVEKAERWFFRDVALLLASNFVQYEDEPAVARTYRSR